LERVDLYTLQTMTKGNASMYYVMCTSGNCIKTETLEEAYNKLKRIIWFASPFETVKDCIESSGEFVTVYGFSQAWITKM